MRFRLQLGSEVRRLRSGDPQLRVARPVADAAQPRGSREGLQPGGRPNRGRQSFRHSPHCPAHRPAAGGRGLGIDLKTVALPREQFRQQMFRLSAMLGMNKVPEAGRVDEPLAVAQHVLPRGIQGDDVTRALTLRQCKGSVFKKRIPCRLRILRSSRDCSSSAHTPTLHGLIPGRNQLIPRS
jgi:hypothetical protein